MFHTFVPIYLCKHLVWTSANMPKNRTNPVHSKGKTSFMCVCVCVSLWGPYMAKAAICEDPEYVPASYSRKLWWILNSSCTVHRFSFKWKIFNFYVVLCCGEKLDYMAKTLSNLWSRTKLTWARSCYGNQAHMGLELVWKPS